MSSGQTKPQHQKTQTMSNTKNSAMSLILVLQYGSAGKGTWHQADDLCLIARIHKVEEEPTPEVVL